MSGEGFGAAQMFRSERLPVEVGQAYRVVIRDNKAADAAAGQHERHIGAQSPGPGDADARRRQGGSLSRGQMRREHIIPGESGRA